jgi:hypothetical protein
MNGDVKLVGRLFRRSTRDMHGRVLRCSYQDVLAVRRTYGLRIIAENASM